MRALRESIKKLFSNRALAEKLAGDVGSRTVRTFRGGPHHQEYQHFHGRGYSPKTNPRFFMFGGLAAAGAGVFYLTHLETVPYTKRRHFVWLSPEMEMKIGAATFDQVKSAAEASKKLLPDAHPAVRMVRKVGHKIERAITDTANRGEGSMDHLKQVKWEYIVVDSEMANAFAAPGGKVCVFSGLIKICKSEDELASIIGHEIAHVAARHGAEKMSWMLVWQVLRIAWVLTTGMGAGSLEAAAALFLALPYSRKMESEADSIGLKLVAKACYDPSAMITMFGTLSKAEEAMLHGHKVPAYLRTHPETTSRQQQIKDQLPEAFKEFRNSGCGEENKNFFQALRSGGRVEVQAGGDSLDAREELGGTLDTWESDDPWKPKGR